MVGDAKSTRRVTIRNPAGKALLPKRGHHHAVRVAIGLLALQVFLGIDDTRFDVAIDIRRPVTIIK